MQRFPRIRADGSFCIIVRYTLRSNHAHLRDHINGWLNQWVDTHQTWTRTWQGGEESVIQYLSYFDDFRIVPQVTSSPDDELWITFEGQAGSRFWKDWVAYITTDLTRAFPEVDPSVRFVDCD